MRFKLALLALTVSLVAGLAHAESADEIVLNAKVYTVEKARPWAEAVAIRGERILAVGSAEQIARYRGVNTKVLDAQHHLVLPGFIDSHIHFMEGSLLEKQLHLEDTKNVAEIQAALKLFATAHPDSPWLLGRGWNYNEFGSETLPNRKDLDAIVSDRPVFLEGSDGHTYWANSKALELAGVTRSMPNPMNGEIVRDKNGDATGALKEAAGDVVLRVVPQPSRDERLTSLRDGLRLANEAGLTQVVSCGNDTPGMSDDAYFDLFDQLRKSGQLTLRFYISNYQAPDRLRAADLDQIEADRKKYPSDDEWLAAGAVKFFLDGVIESHTAAMLGSYADELGNSGRLRWTPEHYKQAVAELDRHGIQVFTHAIGDRAVRLALDAYENAARQNHTDDARHRIEHIETVTAADIPRFGKLHVIASMQPLHTYPDDDTLGPWLKAAGAEREPRAWAWQSIRQNGGDLAFGSDWPVVTLSPWPGLQTAVTRQTDDGKPPGGWVPAQRLTLEEAIEGYTLGAAYGVHREKNQGSLTAGKLADLIILDQDLFQIDPHQINRTKVLLTMVGGKIVYQSSAMNQHATGGDTQ